jgi:hypothetical protein
MPLATSLWMFAVQHQEPSPWRLPRSLARPMLEQRKIASARFIAEQTVSV